MATTQLARKIHLLLPRNDLPPALQYLKKNGPDYCSYVQLPVEGNAYFYHIYVAKCVWRVI